MVFEAVRLELQGLPESLAVSSLATTALVLARELDNTRTSATAKSLCAKSLRETMTQLNEIASRDYRLDAVDELQQRRAQRLAAVAQ